MELKSLAVIFGTVFLAELADKTQLATLLFSAQNPQAKVLVFAAAASALVLACAIGVLAGSFVAQHLDTRLLTRIAGIGFILIGAWTLFRA
ncbi:MAG TPA: TMEM165/GDT1 family protein [Steroidobacteraceae bacterium]|nr:TMEM165/GDT1 family protein [Steroidobacteraceae bacterium]